MTPLAGILWLAAMAAAIHFAIWPSVKAQWEGRIGRDNRPPTGGHRGT